LLTDRSVPDRIYSSSSHLEAFPTGRPPKHTEGPFRQLILLITTECSFTQSSSLNFVHNFVTTPDFLPVIGFIGGVGSGKSAVARWIGDHKNVVIIDGDSIGHKVLKASETKEDIRSRFSDSVFNEQGDVDRIVMGRLVFGSSAEHRQARTDLEQIVHPKIRKEIFNRIQGARSSGNYEAIILDAAVLLEAGWNDMCDVVVFVETSEESRLKRVAHSRGWNANKLKTRESSQLSLDEKRKAADEIIDNTGTLQESGAQLEIIIERTIHEQM
jgi:dephospho-CoA kinase